MSCSLYWKPTKAGCSIGDNVLRDAIEGEYGLPCALDMNAVAFLRGLAAAKVDGARALIDAIEKHGTVEMYKEC